MARTPIERKASENETIHMLSILENIGKKTQPINFKSSILSTLPEKIKNNKEYICKFLLLTAILDQQAESPTARATAQMVYKLFNSEIFDNPERIFKNFDLLKIIDEKAIYKISPAISRGTPRYAWVVLRVGGFLIFEMILKSKNLLLSEELAKTENPEEAASFLNSFPLMKSILREKAIRMYISWIGHPELEINISDDKWNVSEFFMPVDGHVGKVFSRSGMLPIIIHESKREEDSRKNIIVAAQLREPIQQIVSSRKLDVIMVDYGAFVVGYNCCSDHSQNACCDRCLKGDLCKIQNLDSDYTKCPLSDYCKKNLEWRAY